MTHTHTGKQMDTQSDTETHIRVSFGGALSPLAIVLPLMEFVCQYAHNNKPCMSPPQRLSNSCFTPHTLYIHTELLHSTNLQYMYVFWLNINGSSSKHLSL